MQLAGQSKLRNDPKTPTEFFWRVVNAQVTFVPAAEPDGQAKFVLHQNGREITRSRTKPEAR
jgi:hypothetical protein